MAANEDEIRLRLQAETFGYRRAWAEVRVQTARDLAQIRATVANNLAQARTAAAQQLGGIRTDAARNLGQARTEVANNLARIRETTAQNLAQIRVQTARELATIRQNARQTFSNLGGDITGFGSQIKSAGAALTVGLTAPLVGLAAVVTRSALQLDTFRNRLLAVEGSAEAAERRITLLRKLAQDSVGVTTKTALDAYSQFKVIGDITESTIERQIRAFGRLHAAFSIDDPQLFNRNLVQIFSQGFEIKDIREALGRVPIFNQLLETAFGTSDPEKLRQLKAAGKLTLDSFLAGLAGAVETSPVLANIQESLGVRLQKTFERIQFALAPIGETILRTIEPFIEPVARMIERLGAAFASLPQGVRVALVALGAIASIVGPAVIVLGALVGAIGAIVTAISTVGAPVVAGVAAIVVALTAGAAALVVAWQTNFGGIQEITTRVLSAVGSFVQEMVGRLVLFWQENLPLIRRTVETVLTAVQAFWESHGQRITATVSAVWNAIRERITLTLTIVLNAVKLTLSVINGEWQGAWDAYKAIVAAAMNAVGSILRNLPSMVLGVFRAAAGVILSIGEEIKTKVSILALQIGQTLITGIVRGIASTDPRTVLTAALLGAIVGAGEDAKAAAASKGAEAGQAFFNSFNAWASNLGRTDLTGGVGQFVTKPKPAGEGDDEKSRKKAAKIAEEARAGFIKAEATAAETAFQQAVDAAKQAFDETGNLGAFIGAMKKAEADRWKAREDQFKAEREQIRLSAEAEAVKHAQIKTNYAEERQAHADFIRRMAELDREHTDKSLAELQRLNQRARELDEARFNEYVALQKHLAEQDRITNVEAEQRIRRETLAFFQRRLKALQDEQEAAKGNVEALADITHQLALLKEQAEAFMRGDRTRLGAALSADAEEYLEKLTRALEGTKELLRLAEEVPPPEGAVTRGQGPPAQNPFATGPVVNNEAFESEFGPPPAAQWMTFGDVVTEVMGKITSAAGSWGSAVGSVFNGIASAVTQTVQAFGGLAKVGQNLGAFFKAVVSNIAQMAAINALFEGAQAVAAWALSFFWPAMAKKAMLHTQAAAMFALVAGAAGGLSAAIGSGGGTGAAGAMADNGVRGGGRETERDRTIREGRNGGASDPNTVQPSGSVVGHMVVDHKYPDGRVEREVIPLLRRPGPVRDTILELAGMGPSPA